MLRNNVAEYPGSAQKPPSRHEDLMIMYATPEGGARADYFDNEGHVIHDVLSSPCAGEAVFVREASGVGPRFHLSDTLQAEGV